jgi:hypothetical protein
LGITSRAPRDCRGADKHHNSNGEPGQLRKAI